MENPNPKSIPKTVDGAFQIPPLGANNMGTVPTITKYLFPKQGALLGKRVKICYHYNTKLIDEGICVRDDLEEPYQTIFKLNNGRYVLATECMYQEFS